MKVRGGADLARAFESLPQAVQKRVARKSLGPAATMISRELKKSVPNIPTDLAAPLIDRHIEDVTTGVWNDEARYKLYWLKKEGNEKKIARFVERTDAKIGKAITRHIKKGIGRRSKTYTNSQTAMIAVGVRYDFKDRPVGISAGRLAERIEYGDEEVPAMPFMRPAASRVAMSALRVAIDKAYDVVKDEARKAAQKSRAAGRSS
jgi:hypothetical protein